MRLFSSEFAHNYGSYSFGYCNYCIYEPNDKLSKVYSAGYLPYSGSSDVWNTFYMARSSRISLDSWTINSENRRILRKFDNSLNRTEYSLQTFDSTKDFKEFCLSYFERHHGAHTMTKERFNHILKETTLTHIVEYRNKEDDSLAGYVFLAQDTKMTHVWFYFYSKELDKGSFGMWVMLNEAKIAQEQNKHYFYLGTAYGDKSRYKMNFSNLEFWDGGSWLQDKKNKEVKTRIKNDHLQLVDTTDNFKKSKHNYFK